MEYKKIEKNGRTLRVYEDGRIYVEGFFSMRSNGRPYTAKASFRKPSENSELYLMIGLHNKGTAKTYFLHRLLAEAYLPNYSENLYVDHINGDRQDNRISNLRMVTHRQNLHAFRKKQKNTTSKYMGVSFQKVSGSSKVYSKWKASITACKKFYWLGYYDTEEEAALAYNQKALELGFAPERLNIIDETI